MIDLDLFDGGAPASLRRPVHEIIFGGDGGGAGGLLDVLSASGPDPWQRSLGSVVIQAGLAPHADVATVSLAADDQAPSIAIDDEGSIALGYEDSSAEVVFTGKIDSVDRSIGGAVLATAVNGGAALSRLRLNQSFEQQTAGEIVGELAGMAGIGTDTVEDGIELPFYVIDDRQNAYQHITALARKSGFLAYFDPKGDLNFGPFTGGESVQAFTYGVDIIALRVIDAAAIAEGITTIGDGAAGSAGQEAWSWLIKDPSPVEGQAGGGEAGLLLQDASLRSGDAAQTCAEAIVGAVGRMTLLGRMLVPGAPTVVVGSTIETKDAPDEALNGLHMVRHVRHRFSKSEGFTTLIDFCKTGDSGIGGFGGLL